MSRCYDDHDAKRHLSVLDVHVHELVLLRDDLVLLLLAQPADAQAAAAAQAALHRRAPAGKNPTCVRNGASFVVLSRFSLVLFEASFGTRSIGQGGLRTSNALASGKADNFERTRQSFLLRTGPSSRPPSAGLAPPCNSALARSASPYHQSLP